MNPVFQILSSSQSGFECDTEGATNLFCSKESTRGNNPKRTSQTHLDRNPVVRVYGLEQPLQLVVVVRGHVGLLTLEVTIKTMSEYVLYPFGGEEGDDVRKPEEDYDAPN